MDDYQTPPAINGPSNYDYDDGPDHAACADMLCALEQVKDCANRVLLNAESPDLKKMALDCIKNAEQTEDDVRSWLVKNPPSDEDSSSSDGDLE